MRRRWSRNKGARQGGIKKSLERGSVARWCPGRNRRTGHRSPCGEVSRHSPACTADQLLQTPEHGTNWRNDVVYGYQVREVFGALEAGGTLRRQHLLCGVLRNDVPLRKVHETQAADGRKGSFYYS